MKHYAITPKLLDLYTEIDDILRFYTQYFLRPGSEEIDKELSTPVKAVIKIALDGDISISEVDFELSQDELERILDMDEIEELVSSEYLENYQLEIVVGEMVVDILDNCGIFKDYISPALRQEIRDNVDVSVGSIIGDSLGEAHNTDDLENCIRRAIAREILP